jgi:hypothetical protein
MTAARKYALEIAAKDVAGSHPDDKSGEIEILARDYIMLLNEQSQIAERYRDRSEHHRRTTIRRRRAFETNEFAGILP